MNNMEIEQIVKQVLAGMQGTGNASAPKAAGPVPEKARVAMLTDIEKIELQEYKIPEIGDDDILVKVEGCGICGTDFFSPKLYVFAILTPPF